jgi:5-methyltetrahydropteroyltriglutamate--homocysteine methyltransferase
MRRSIDRILTTHVGSLARPLDLLELMREKEHGRPYDADAYAERVTSAVAEVVAEQVKAGLDVVTDGELGKVSFLTYVKDRLGGFDTASGERLMPPSWQVEIDAFPEYYAGYLGKYKDQVSPMTTMVCTGPVTYQGHAQLQTDIANLRAALAGHDVVEAFLPSTSPSGFGRNEHYPSYGEYLAAVAEALREEYLAIVDAGLPAAGRRPVADRVPVGEPGDDARAAPPRRRAARRGSSTTPCAASRREDPAAHLLRPQPRPPRPRPGLPRHRPAHAEDQRGAYSFEVANPRHQHEWKIWRDVPLPDGKVLIPGLLGHASNYVEHPELIADTIELYAGIVGRENVIAGADCGFSSRASFHPEVHPTVVWEKFRALADGARLASRRLW